MGVFGTHGSTNLKCRQTCLAGNVLKLTSGIILIFSDSLSVLSQLSHLGLHLTEDCTLQSLNIKLEILQLLE